MAAIYADTAVSSSDHLAHERRLERCLCALHGHAGLSAGRQQRGNRQQAGGLSAAHGRGDAVLAIIDEDFSRANTDQASSISSNAFARCSAASENPSTSMLDLVLSIHSRYVNKAPS